MDLPRFALQMQQILNLICFYFLQRCTQVSQQESDIL